MSPSQKQEEIEKSLFYVKTPKTLYSRTSPANKTKNKTYINKLKTPKIITTPDSDQKQKIKKNMGF